MLATISVRGLAHDTGSDQATPVVMHWKDGTSQQATLPVFGAREILFKRLAAVTKGPVALPGDSQPLGTSLIVVSTNPDAEIWNRVFGAGRTLRDLGLVAVVSPKGAVHKTCGPYGEVQAKYKITIADADVTIYDRATGKKKTRKTFSGGSKSCPKQIEVSVVQKNYSDVLAFDMDEVDTWLRTQAK